MAVDTTRVARAHRIGAEVLAALVLLQAVVAGQALFGDWSIKVHGYLGNASFTLGVILLGLAVAGRSDRVRLALTAVLVAAMFAQTGLGYVGRETLGAAAWHVPLGVTIFGLAVFLVARPSSVDLPR